MRITKALIPAGGLDTRLFEETTTRPKPIHQCFGRERPTFDRVLILGGKPMSRMLKYLVKTVSYDNFQRLIGF